MAKDSVADPSQGFRARITPDESAGIEPFDAVIAYYAPSQAPPGPQPAPEPLPPIVIIPPVPSPIPEPVPAPPEVFGGNRTFLTLSEEGWKWIVIPPVYEPPESGMPQPKRGR